MSQRRRFGRRLSQPPATVREQHDQLRSAIEVSLEGLEIYRSDDRSLGRESETPIRELRRRGFKPEDDRLGTMSLVDQDGVLRWMPGGAARFSRRGRSLRRRGPGSTPGAVVEQLRFEKLERSQVGDFLNRLDCKLNPVLQTAGSGKLRSLTRGLGIGSLTARPKPKGRVLLLVHGTFSNSNNFHENLHATDEGRKFLAGAAKRYDQVLFFDHPTLQVSPVLNALDLERRLAGSEARFDIVCHSRGGLVTRWWCEALTHDPERIGKVVFVGSPIAGTSLAAPPKLKQAMDYFTNVFNALAKVSELAHNAQPLMVVVTGLLKVLQFATRGLATTPVLDVGVAAIPGLVGQSRVGDNAEIRRLRDGVVPLDHYYAVLSDFEPDRVGWRFWQSFTRKPGQRLLNAGADLLFEDSNDLVVDTSSMTDFKSDLKADIPASRTCSFDTDDEVHHLNYFHQPRTIDFLRRTLLPRD